MLATVFISLPNVPLISILFLSQVGNGILLPFILVYMLVIANDKKIMGEYVNTRVFNYIAGNGRHHDRIEHIEHHAHINRIPLTRAS